MFEQFGFEMGFIERPFEVNFNDLQGMKCVSVSDTASVGYSIQSTENPFFDGQQFQARRAQGREMEIVFCYDFTIPPEEADKNFFLQISPGISQKSYESQDNFRLFKIQNGVKKIIFCSIKSIEHQVYKEEPQLQIVLSTEAYWRGERETLFLERDQSKDTTGMQAFTFEAKGDVAADCLCDLYFRPKEGIESVDTHIKVDMDFQHFPDGTFMSEKFPLIMQDATSFHIEIGWGKDNAGNGAENKFTFVMYEVIQSQGILLYDYQKENFIKLYPFDKILKIGTYNWSNYFDLSVKIYYTPLYIR